MKLVFIANNRKEYKKMFGNAKKRGIDNFNGCPHKTIEESPLPVASGNPLDIGNFWGHFNATLDPGMEYPRKATVDCPITTREVVGRGTKEGVRGQLCAVMGKEVCKNCPMIIKK